jgi:hypothetical protein
MTVVIQGEAFTLECYTLPLEGFDFVLGEWLKSLGPIVWDSSYQSALHTAPFQVVFGRPPPSLIKYQARTFRVAFVDTQLKGWDEFLQQIRERLLLAQDVVKAQPDTKHRNLEFQVGD